MIIRNFADWLIKKTIVCYPLLIKTSFVFNFFTIGILLSFFAFCFSNEALPANQVSSKEQQQQPSEQNHDVKTMRIVRIGYYPFDGFHMYDKNGKRFGYGYDYLQKLRDYTNWKFEFSDPRHEWPEMLDMLRTNKVDLVAGVSKNKERENEFAFSKEPIYQVSTILTVKAGNTRYRNEDYAKWNGFRVGMLKNSTQNEKFVNFSKEKGFSFRPVYFDKLSDLVNALQEEKKIDAIVTSSMRAVKGNEWILTQFYASFMYIAVRKNDESLLKELNWGMEQLDSFSPGFQKQLRRIYYAHEHGRVIPFSQQESVFLNEVKKSGHVFSVIINPDRKPFSWYEDGKYHGLLVDYAAEISKRSGLKLQFIPARTRAEYYQKRFSPETDIVFDMLWDFREAEDNQLKLSQPYFSASVSKLRDKSVGNVFKTVSILEGGDLQDRVRVILPLDVKIRYCKSISELINDVKSTASDAAYLYTRSAEYAVYEDESNRLVSEYVPSLETSFTLGVKEDLNPLLLSVLNRTILSLDDAFANQIRKKYAPQFKEIFSFRMFVHRYPIWAIGLPCAVLLLVCAFLTSLLILRSRHRKVLKVSAAKWDVASRITKLHPFQMNITTRHIYDDIEQFNLFWPVVNGTAVMARDWVCPEDLPKIKKAHDDFIKERSDHIWATYRVIQDGVTRHFVIYALRDANDPNMMVGIIHDISDAKNIESQRDDVQQLWQKVVDNMPIMMFVKSEADDFRYIQCNKNFAEFLGRTPEQVVGHTDAELFNRPEDTDSFRSRDLSIMASHEAQKFQETAENANGDLCHIQTVKMSLKEANGRSLLIGMSVDITELQNSRDEAQKHEEIFRLTIQSIGDAVLTTDKSGNVQMLNPAAEQLIGLRTEDVKGKPHEEVFRIVNALDNTPLISPLKKALDYGRTAELGNYTDLLSFDGHRYHVADCASPIRNRNNDIIGAVLIFRNVTEEYRHREEMRSSIALWNITSDITKLAPFRLHIPTRKVYGDLERLNQYWPIVDGKAMRSDDWIYPDDLEQANKEYENFLSGTSNHFLITFRAVRDGKIRYYRRYAEHDAHDPDILVGIIQDITIDKELEQDRDDSHALWDQVINAMPILMFVKTADDDFKYIQCNKNFANFIGKKREDILGHTDGEIFPREIEKEHFRKWDSKIMDEGKVQEFYEEAQGANKYYHFQTVKMPFTDTKGNHLLIGLAVDISAYKKAEEERNAAQRLFNNAFAAMPIILYIKSADDDFRYLQCNNNFCKLFGKTESEVLGRTDEEIFPHVQEVLSFYNTDREAMRSGVPMEFIESLSGADNKTYHFRSVKMPATDVNGKAILIGMAVNITELVEQRELMQAARIQLEAGCLMSRSFTFELDSNRNISTTNGLYKELVPHVNGKPLAIKEWVLPEDIEDPTNKIQAFFDNQCSEVTINFRTDWFGKRRYYKSILKAENGKVYGVTSDVTELLETLEDVKTNALMWKQVMDELPVRFFVKDVDNECRYLMCNKANADFLGLSEEEVIGRTTEEICKPSQEIDTFLKEERQILVNHCVSHSRVNIPDPNGMIREMEKIEMPITGIRNRSLLVSIAFDITEREQSLRLAEISARILAGIVGEPDFTKVLNYIGTATTEVLNCRRVIFAKCDQEGRLHFLQDAGVDPNYHFSEKAIEIHEFYWNCYLDRLNRNELVAFERMGDDPLMEPLFKDYPEYRNRALVGTPVVVNGKLHGVMIITFNKPHQFTENDARTLRAIGNCIMLAENRSQQNAALLAAQEEQTHQLAERTALNECLAIFMGSDYMDIPFEQILESIRHHLGASHCYVLRTDFETKSETCLAEASIDKNHKFLMGCPPFSFDPDSQWYTELKEKSIIGRNTFSLDEILIRLGKTQPPIKREHPICSLWDAAIIIKGEIWGTLGVIYDDLSEKKFNANDESFVLSAARVVALILTRAQHRNDLILALETQLNTAECLRCMVGDEDAAAAMRRLLDIIQKHTGADATFMTELNEDPDTSHFWGNMIMNTKCSNLDMEEVSFDPNEDWYLLFKKDKPLFMPDTNKVAAENVLGSWSFLLRQDPQIKSYYEFPIHCNGRLWGSIGIIYKGTSVPLNHNHSEFMMNAKNFFEILLARQANTRKLNEALQQAQAAEKAKSYFLASMSHEIRTPLNAVIGFTELLKDAETTDSIQKEYVDNIFIAGNALLQLINDILDLSKLEAGQMQLSLERVDFHKFCHNICKTFNYSTKQKELELIVDVPESIPALMLDHMRMRQIFFNLIGNSVKFTPNGGMVKVSASFSQLTASGGSLMLKFSDTGIGMPDADQKKIFEPFVQLSKMRGTNASNNGTGLGLPIVRRLVDRMGGTLTVESTENKGTTFFILLPHVNLAENKNIQETQSVFMPDTEDRRGSMLNINKNTDRRLKVLVVDDVPINIKIITVLLRRFGVDFETADTGLKALHKLENDSFDWVLTDLCMAGMSGAELAEIIRKNPKYKNIRLAVVTAEVDALAFDKNLFDSVLSKPINRQQLCQCLFGGEK